MRIRSWLMGTIIFSAVGICWGDGYRNPPSDVTALGRSGAGYTLTDDVGVLAFTPARVLSVAGRQAELNVSFANTEIEHRGLDGVKTKNDDTYYVLPNLFANVPLTEDLVLGLAATTPYGQGIEYDRSSRLAMGGPYRAELTMVDLAPSLAWRAHEQLWVSAGLDIYFGQLEFDQNIPWSALGGPAGIPPGKASVDSDDEQVGVTLSASLQPAENHTLTATWRSGPSMDFSGDLSVATPPFPTPLSPKSDFDATIDFPNQLALAYGLQVNEALQVEVYAEWLEWSRNKSITFNAGANQLLIPGPTVNDWDDTISYGTGASYQASPELTLHGGYAFIETPIPTSTLSPSLVDSDRHALSLGCSFENGAHRIDVAGTFSMYDDRDVVNPALPFLSGTYETSSTLVGISYAFTY